jgi:hypothetical protein
MITKEVETLLDPAVEGLVGDDHHFRLGSSFSLIALTESLPKLGVKQSISVTTSAFGGKLSVARAWP